MLKPVVDNGGLELWSDARLVAGETWRPELFAAIERSRAALLLVTESFLASSFIMGQELPALVKHGAVLLPVLVDHCLWEQVMLLREVQWLHDPSEGAIVDAPNPARPIVEVCRKLCELELVGADRPVAGVAGQRASVPALAAAKRSGVTRGVPALPPGFVARGELDGLREALLGEGVGSIAITGRRALGLHGQGGIGKTVLAAALARDPDLLHYFPDGVHWVTLGERTDIIAAQIALLSELGAPAPEVRNASEGRQRLCALLDQRRCLIVADDVWTAVAAEAFNVAGPGGRVLYTTRDPAVLRAVHAEVREIEVLSEDASRELLARLSGTAVGDLPPDAERVLVATGRVALALALVGAAVGRGGHSWRQVADALEQAGETFLDHPYANTFKAIQVAVSALEPGLRAAYESLVVYPEDTRVSVAAVQRWWAHQHALSPQRSRELLQRLATAELLALEENAFAFHDLQREFLLLHADGVRLLHHDVLQAYRALLPSPTAPWRQLPPDEPYIWEHLLEHLTRAGDRGGARQVATDLGYLALRAFRGGPHASEADVRRAAAIYPDDRAIQWSLRVLAQWGHLLSGHERIADLAATLATRIAATPAGVDTAGLNDLLPALVLDARWGLPDAPDALKRVLQGHSDWVRAVAFSPDGRMLASAGDDWAVRLWDPATGSQNRVLQGHRGWVWGVAFSPDGRTLASASDDETVRLWDVATGSETRVLEGHRRAVWGVACSPDGRMLASAGEDWTVRLWDVATGVETIVLRGHGGGVRAVAFSPDGGTLASAGADETVRLWNPGTGTKTGVLEGHRGGVWAVTFSPDGGTLASVGTEGLGRLWEPATRSKTRVLEGHTDGVVAVAFAPNGRIVASAGADWTVRLWDLRAGAQASILEGHGGGVWSVAFAPYGILASAGVDRAVRLWDAARGTQASVLEGHSDVVRTVAFSPDGRTLASAGDDETVRLWDPVTGRKNLVLEDHGGGVRTIAFSPDARTLASAGYDGTVRLWDPTTGTQTTVLTQGHIGEVWAVAFSPDGRTLAGAGVVVRLWNATTGTPISVLRGHKGGVRTVAFSPDGRLLASAGADGTVRLWDPATGSQTSVLKGHTDSVRAVAFSPDGRLLASASGDGTIRLWDPSTGSQTRVLNGHAGKVQTVAFLPDGHILASGGHDGTVRLWDPAAGTQTVSVRIGTAVAALAADQRAIAIGFDRSVACLRVLVPASHVI